VPRDILLKTTGLTKEFSGVRVLNDINIEIWRGEILGIIGENGAGKSTLVKILNGTYTPTCGQIYFEGQPVQIRETSIAKRLGISMIPQEFNLIAELNVYENVFLGQEYQLGWFLLDTRRMRAKTRELLTELNTTISPDEKIQNLSVAGKQMVEIAKAIAQDCKLLIMDEPTTVLTAPEVETLFELMRRLKQNGVTIIYISHKLKEVREICDRVLILRDGEFVSLDPAGSLDLRTMANRMVGREVGTILPPKVTPTEEVIMEVEGLTVPGLVKEVSFQLKKGEILGFAGLRGAGRTELAEALIGVRKKTAGQIILAGTQRRINSPIDAVKNRIAYLSEDRQGIGILTDFDLASNVTLVSLPKYFRFLINRAVEKDRAEYYVDAFGIKTGSVHTRVEYLSGGNQQKVSLAKSLDPAPLIFIVDEPTRGIDVNAKREVYYFLHELVESGISCILISSELEELVGMANRVAVMREGCLVCILEGEQITEEEIMYYATGVTGGVSA